MNSDDPMAQTRSHDAGLNAARTIMPDASAETVALAAFMMNRGLISMEELRGYVMVARAIPSPRQLTPIPNPPALASSITTSARSV